MNFLSLIKGVLLGGVKPVTDTSGTLELNKVDWAKVVVHALIVGIAAAVTVISQVLSGINFGEYNAVVVPIISTVITWLTKFLKNNDPLPPAV